MGEEVALDGRGWGRNGWDLEVCLFFSIDWVMREILQLS